mmetsp:Transcript_11553/g.38614  ORF Transcript_11553/g.38614 Transcript_11553/m.38614 type:complete len:647 (-) Transcript_11553:98-2038(-)
MLDDLGDLLADVMYSQALQGADGTPDPKTAFRKCLDADWQRTATRLDGEGKLTAAQICAGPVGMYYYGQFMHDLTDVEVGMFNFCIASVEYAAAATAVARRRKLHKIEAMYLSGRAPPRNSGVVFPDDNTCRPVRADEVPCTKEPGRRPSQLVVRKTSFRADWPLTMEAIQAAGGVPAEATPDALELLERRVFSVVSLYAPQFRSSKYFKSFVAFTWREAQPILSTYFHKFRTIGRGGFGCVYGCKTLTTGKMYALKEVDMKRMKQRKAQALCYSEHEVLKKLKSPFSVNLKYAFHERGKLILIIDLMMGGDLKYWLKEHGTFDATFLRYAAARTILALEAIHAIGFIHRDIKPENMLLDESGRVRISDLGLATRLSPSPRGVSGTPGYFAPEMLLGLHYDQRVDYWSFGCMVVECITGRCPFHTKEAQHWPLPEGVRPPPSGSESSESLKTPKRCQTRSLDNPGRSSMYARHRRRSESIKNPKEAKKDLLTFRMELAVVEMPPDLGDAAFLQPEIAAMDAADFCSELLIKNPDKRLGAHGVADILSHQFFASLSWDAVRGDTMEPPFAPGRALNFKESDTIGSFVSLGDTVKIEDGDFDVSGWTFTSKLAFQSEAVWLLKWEARMRAEDPKWRPETDKSKTCSVS